jgi:hypothetical protein
MGMASDEIGWEKVMHRDRTNCFVGKGRVTLLDKNSERQLDCTDLRLCWGWGKRRDTWQHSAMHVCCTWLMD